MAIVERRRLTEEQGRALVRQWRQSRETKAEFCRRRGVGVHVLRYWLARDAERPETVQAQQGNFVVVSASPGSTPRSEPFKEEAPVHGANAVLVVMQTASATLLAQTVRELLGGSVT